MNQTVGAFFSNITMSPTPLYISLSILAGLIVIFIFLRKKNHVLFNIHLINVYSYLIAFSFLSSARHPHYYHPIYLSFFLVLAHVFSLLMSKSSVSKIIIFIFFASYIAFNLRNCYFLYGKATSQIRQAQKVADFLSIKIEKKPFNIATWPVEFFEDQYLYFLELKGLIPADRAKREITEQMFVLCAKEPCRIIDSPSWNISMFGKAKIDTIWTVEGIKIYKLIHENNTRHPLL